MSIKSLDEGQGRLDGLGGDRSSPEHTTTRVVGRNTSIPVSDTAGISSSDVVIVDE